jgi:threonine synthase
VRQLRQSGWLSGQDQVVVLNTGAGLKYPQTVRAGAGTDIPVLAADDSIMEAAGHARR